MNGQGISKRTRESKKRRWIFIPLFATATCRSVLRLFGNNEARSVWFIWSIWFVWFFG